MHTSGTGNYIDVVKHKVGSCQGLEFNLGMLAQSKAKHAGDNRVTLQQVSPSIAWTAH